MITLSSIIRRPGRTLGRSKVDRGETTVFSLVQYLYRGIRSVRTNRFLDHPDVRPKTPATGSYVAAAIKAWRLDSDSEVGSSGELRRRGRARELTKQTKRKERDGERRREAGGRQRKKKGEIALRSASRCRVHRFRLLSTTLDTPKRILTLTHPRARLRARSHERPNREAQREGTR